MFYTKYRPQKFSEIIKPNEAAEALSREVKNGKTVHAYLFVGSRGTGKTTVARILAKALNCKKLRPDGDPCDKCDFCVAIKEGRFYDLIEIDAASNRGIDDIRDLKDKVRLAPSRGKRKIYIIDEVHMMTAEAFNALLKTLEEPPKNVVFILCTTEAHKVPETIKSRCQVFRFRRASIGQIVNKLKAIAKVERIKISETDLQKIAKASFGGFRDAETLFQQIVEGELDVQTLLSIGSRDTYIEFVENLVGKKASKAIKIVNKVFEEGVDLNLWSGELLKYLRELLFVKSGALEQIEDLNDELISEIREQAQTVELDWLVNALNKLLEAQKEIKGSSIPQLPLEIFITEVALERGRSIWGNGRGGNDDDDASDEKGQNDEENLGVPGRVVKILKKQDKSLEKPDKKDENTQQKVKNKAKKEITNGESEITLEKVEEKWKEVLKKSNDLNHSITTLLKSGKLVGLEGKFLIFEVSYPFHKERLESHKNRGLIEDLLEEVYGVSLGVKCTICKEKPKSKYRDTGVLTDYNVSMPPLEEATLLDVFDGGLPNVK
jgi:DNA polymerase-3 subunit gamma/tau